jgi:hypothetical protein
LARHVQEELRSDNDSFAKRVWGKSWADVFAVDVSKEFTPNDFEVRRPDWFTARRLRRAITKMKAFAQDILLNPALGVGSTLEQSGEPERVGFKRINPESTRGQAFDLIYHNRSELRALLARDYD